MFDAAVGVAAHAALRRSALARASKGAHDKALAGNTQPRRPRGTRNQASVLQPQQFGARLRSR